MYNAFTMLLNMSFTAGILSIAVILFRFCFRKVPKKYICILWAFVGLRLLCPVSLPSSLSVFNLMNTGTNSLGHVEYFRYSGTTEKPELLLNLPGVISGNMSSGSMTNGPHTSDLYLPVVMDIWLLGVIAMLAYALFSYIKLKKETSASILCKDHIFICDEIKSPFILGFIRPMIYLPSGMDESTRKHVIAHERAHIKRKDHWWKPLGYILLSLHWFNPVLWIAYIFLCRDIETACDEKVISAMDKAGIVAYSEALLVCAAQRRMITACPVAFGENDVKSRIKNVMNYKKPAFWIVGFAIIGCVAAGVFFMTDPLFKPYSFVIDGEVFSAEVINGEEMKLVCLPIDESSTWQVTGNPNIFVNDDSLTYMEVDRQHTELHFTALGSGNGYTTIQHIAADGSNDFSYELKMVIKRHGKHLQIEEVSVTPIPVELNVMNAVIQEIDNGVMLVTPLSGSPELEFADLFSVAIQNMAPSPEPQVGNTVQIVHNGEILETSPAQLGKVYNIGVVSRDTCPAIFIDGITYYDTGREMPMGALPEDENNTIEYVEIPLGGTTTGKASAWSKVDDHTLAVLIDEVWYEFVADGRDNIIYTDTLPKNEFTEKIPKPSFGTVDYVIDTSQNGSYFVFWKDITMKDAKSYIAQLQEKGYALLSASEENASCGWLLQNADTVLNIAASDSGMGVQITYPASIANAGGNEGPVEYTLTIGDENVAQIDILIQGKEIHLHDGDGVSFTKGAKLKFEEIDGYPDLRGLQITAYDKKGNVIFSGGVPDTSDNRGFTHFEIDGWIIEQEQ